MILYICDVCERAMGVDQNRVSVSLNVGHPRVQKGQPAFDGHLCDGCLKTFTTALVAILPKVKTPGPSPLGFTFEPPPMRGWDGPNSEPEPVV
jgi:hypothetical protein